MSASSCLNTAMNFGLEVCMRLLDARAWSSAALMMLSSSCVNMDASFRVAGRIPGMCVVVDGVCSVKPERQDNVDNIPVSPARLDQPRYHYPRKIGRRPMGDR